MWNVNHIYRIWNASKCENQMVFSFRNDEPAEFDCTEFNNMHHNSKKKNAQRTKRKQKNSSKYSDAAVVHKNQKRNNIDYIVQYKIHKTSKHCHKSCKYWIVVFLIRKRISAKWAKNNKFRNKLYKTQNWRNRGSWARMINLSLYPNTFMDMHYACMIHISILGLDSLTRQNEAIANEDIIFIILMKWKSNIRLKCNYQMFLNESIHLLTFFIRFNLILSIRIL